jgi:hypothetical protein
MPPDSPDTDFLKKYSPDHCASNVRNGSLAAPRYRISSMSAVGCMPAIPQRLFKEKNLNVCFYRKRPFNYPEIHRNDSPLIARSGRR